MARRSNRGSDGERGFTLAALIVILSIMMIFVAYTVPKQWSAVLQREREQQTIFIMRQYARAILEFQHQHANAMPTSMDQLRQARQPRVIRWKDDPVDPLTGQVDWLIVPAAAANQGRTINNSQINPSFNSSTSTSSTSTSSTSTNGPATPGAPPIMAFPMKDYAGGPFIGIRSPKTGKSMVVFNGADTYDQWLYTSVDLQNEITMRINAYGMIVGAPMR